MRYDVKKFTFIGLKKEQTKFFEMAQEAGLVDFIDDRKGKPHEVPQDIQNLIDANKVLRGLPTLEQEVMGDFVLADGLAHQILTLRNTLEKLAEEERVTQLEIARVEVFGQFSLDDIAFIERNGDRKVQFYFARHGVEEHKELPREVLYVGSDHGLDYFMAINSELTQYDKMIEMKIEHPLGELRKRFGEIKVEMHETEQRLKPYAKYKQFLYHALVHKLNRDHLARAQELAHDAMDDSLFYVEGWVPENKLHKLNTLVKELNVHTDEIAIEAGDKIPTYLENTGMHRVGEDLVHIYDTPSHTDKDPSLWVLVFFALFFAMIIGDGGYGFLFLGLAVYLKVKFPDMKQLGKRMWKLVLVLSLSCIAWGFLTNAFFGIKIDPENPLRKVSVLNWLAEKKAGYHIAHQDATYQEWLGKFPQLKGITDPHQFLLGGKVDVVGVVNYEIYDQLFDGILLELALIVGMLHVILSLCRYLGRNWSGIGWIAFIVGCYLYFPSYLDTTSLIDFLFDANKELLAKEGIYLMVGGLVTAVAIGVIRYSWLGILELANVIQIFADVLSYLRLYALGLAGTIMSATANEIAASTTFVVGILILLIGHSVNIVLAIMGGIIHGLRLNFLEWYHYSFDGGGKLFTPLEKIEID